MNSFDRSSSTQAVWLPVAIAVLACVGPAVGAAQQLQPADVPPLPYERLDSTLNRVVEIFETSGRSAVAARRATQGVPLQQDGSVAVTFHVDGASNVQALERYLRTNGGDPRNVGEDYIEAYVPVALLAARGKSRHPGIDLTGLMFYTRAHGNGLDARRRVAAIDMGSDDGSASERGASVL